MHIRVWAISQEKWALSYGGRKRNELMTTNFSEVFKSVVNELERHQEQPIYRWPSTESTITLYSDKKSLLRAFQKVDHIPLRFRPAFDIQQSLFRVVFNFQQDPLEVKVGQSNISPNKRGYHPSAWPLELDIYMLKRQLCGPTVRTC